MLKFNYQQKLTKDFKKATMKTITQIARFRQSVVKFSLNFGVNSAVKRFNVSRASVYRWRKRYDGSPESLVDISRRPHHHPNAHSDDELKLISDIHRRQPDIGLVVLTLIVPLLYQ